MSFKTFTNQAVVYPLLSQSANGDNYAAHNTAVQAQAALGVTEEVKKRSFFIHGNKSFNISAPLITVVCTAQRSYHFFLCTNYSYERFNVIIHNS